MRCASVNHRKSYEIFAHLVFIRNCRSRRNAISRLECDRWKTYYIQWSQRSRNRFLPTMLFNTSKCTLKTEWYKPTGWSIHIVSARVFQLKLF